MGLTNRTLVPQSVFGQHALKIRPQGCYRRSRSRARVGWRLGRRESRPTRQQRPTGAKEVLSPPDGRRIRQPLNGTGRDAQLPFANQRRRGAGRFPCEIVRLWLIRAGRTRLNKGFSAEITSHCRGYSKQPVCGPVRRRRCVQATEMFIPSRLPEARNLVFTVSATAP
jgi:hypothetical protein